MKQILVSYFTLGLPYRKLAINLAILNQNSSSGENNSQFLKMQYLRNRKPYNNTVAYYFVLVENGLRRLH